MMTPIRKAIPVLGITLLAPATALAHPGHAAGNLMAGVLHPLTGLDHVLMIVAVSAWAALLAPKARLLIAACLASCVGIGASLPVAGGAGLEAAIALTVVGAGLLLATGRKLPIGVTASIAAVFALVHGFAHGSEGPGASAVYVAGLVLSTGLLATLVSFAVARWHAAATLWRVTGAVSAAAGVFAFGT